MNVSPEFHIRGRLVRPPPGKAAKNWVCAVCNYTRNAWSARRCGCCGRPKHPDWLAVGNGTVLELGMLVEVGGTYRLRRAWAQRAVDDALAERARRVATAEAAAAAARAAAAAAEEARLKEEKEKARSAEDSFLNFLDDLGAGDRMPHMEFKRIQHLDEKHTAEAVKANRKAAAAKQRQATLDAEASANAQQRKSGEYAAFYGMPGNVGMVTDIDLMAKQITVHILREVPDEPDADALAEVARVERKRAYTATEEEVEVLPPWVLQQMEEEKKASKDEGGGEDDEAKEEEVRRQEEGKRRERVAKADADALARLVAPRPPRMRVELDAVEYEPADASPSKVGTSEKEGDGEDGKKAKKQAVSSSTATTAPLLARRSEHARRKRRVTVELVGRVFSIPELKELDALEGQAQRTLDSVLDTGKTVIKLKGRLSRLRERMSLAKAGAKDGQGGGDGGQTPDNVDAESKHRVAGVAAVMAVKREKNATTGSGRGRGAMKSKEAGDDLLSEEEARMHAEAIAQAHKSVTIPEIKDDIVTVATRAALFSFFGLCGGNCGRTFRIENGNILPDDQRRIETLRAKVRGKHRELRDIEERREKEMRVGHKQRILENSAERARVRNELLQTRVKLLPAQLTCPYCGWRPGQTAKDASKQLFESLGLGK